MEFRFLVLLLLVEVAFANELDECEEAEVKKCVANFKESSVEDQSEEEVCRVGRVFLDCIKGGLKKCSSDDDDLDENLQALESMYQKRCGDDGGLTEDGKICFEDHEEYIKGCMGEVIEGMTEMVLQVPDLDENIVTCLTFNGVRNCVSERVTEKCGAEAGAEFDDEIGRAVPIEVYDACNAESTLEFFADVLLENRKKRR